MQDKLPYESPTLVPCGELKEITTGGGQVVSGVIIR